MFADFIAPDPHVPDAAEGLRRAELLMYSLGIGTPPSPRTPRRAHAQPAWAVPPDPELGRRSAAAVDRQP